MEAEARLRMPPNLPHGIVAHTEAVMALVMLGAGRVTACDYPANARTNLSLCPWSCAV
ncbi:MAG: hypothetical protein R2838_16290 [Caldilineaceae bacterium]